MQRTHENNELRLHRRRRERRDERPDNAEKIKDVKYGTDAIGETRASPVEPNVGWRRRDLWHILVLHVLVWPDPEEVGWESGVEGGVRCMAVCVNISMIRPVDGTAGARWAEHIALALPAQLCKATVFVLFCFVVFLFRFLKQEQVAVMDYKQHFYPL